jgi:hypothetical protein
MRLAQPKLSGCSKESGCPPSRLRRYGGTAFACIRERRLACPAEALGLFEGEWMSAFAAAPLRRDSLRVDHERRLACPAEALRLFEGEWMSAFAAAPLRRDSLRVHSRAKAGVPNGIRTRVLALKGPRPGPLDDGDPEACVRSPRTGRSEHLMITAAAGIPKPRRQRWSRVSPPPALSLGGTSTNR